MKKVLLVIPLIILCLLCITCSPTSSAPPSDSSSNNLPGSGDSQPYQGDLVRTFTGDGDRTTSTFHIGSDTWKITWDIDSDWPDYVVFYINLYRSSGSFVGYASSSDTGYGNTWVYAGSGDYYISVISANCDWEIKVYE